MLLQKDGYIACLLIVKYGIINVLYKLKEN